VKGDANQAWRNIILLYNRNPSYQTAECKHENSNVLEYDEDKLVYIPFLIALEDFLKK